MNETTTPSGAPGERPGGAQSGPDQHGPAAQNGLDRFFTWLRGLGIVRGDERWFAGVAGGIAAKAGIDPLIVRGVFVVLAVLGGPGILLYLAGWLLLPDVTGRIHLEEVLRGRASAGVIVTAVILGALVIIPVVFSLVPGLFSGFGWGPWSLMPDWLQIVFGILWWVVIVPGLIIWLIVWLSSRDRPGARPQEWQAATGADASAGAAAQGAASFTAGISGPAEQTGPQQPFAQKAENWGQNFEQKAEDWGRRAEQKSREWEQRFEQHYEARKLGAAHVLITLACALLAAGAAALWASTLPTAGGTVLTAALVASVAVLGASLIIAGIRGRHTGWIGFLSFVGVIALVFAPFSTIMPERTEFVPFGNAALQPGSEAANRGLVLIAGNATVDLSQLVQRAAPREIDVWVLAGNITVKLPESHPTEVQVHLLAGNVRDQRLDEGDRRQGGIFMARSIASGTAGHDASEITHVRVRLLAGNVYVEGGTASEASSSLSARERERAAEIEQLRKQIEELEKRR